MTLEDSIALAESFQKDLAKLESCERQIRSNEEEIRKPVNITVRRRSMFRYFWPWILFAGTIFCLVMFFSLVLMTSDFAKYVPLISIGAVVLAVVIIIIGIVTSKKKAKDDNGAYEIARDIAEKKKAELFDKNRELESTINEIEIRLGGNPEYTKIPSDKRKSSVLARAKLLMQSGKATDFDDAMGKV